MIIRFQMQFDYQRFFYVIASACLVFAVLIVARVILIPIAFSLLMAFILFPLVKKLEKFHLNKIVSAFVAIMFVISLVAGGLYLFSSQIMELSKEFVHFQNRVLLVFTDVTVYINKNINIVPNLEKDELFEGLKTWLNQTSGAFLKTTFNNTVSFTTDLFAVTMYTFMFLIYRSGLVHAFSMFASKTNRIKVIQLFKSIQEVGQTYLVGMIVLVIVIGFANSIGLWIIGIDNPFLFGFIGALLSIIPYVGTIVGAIIPLIYAFVSYDSLWMPLSVALLFWSVQLITDNFLSPRIVGKSLRLNALSVILSLIVGASVWGISGMILFLPFGAMLKVTFEAFTPLKPFALILGDFSKSSQT